MHAPSAAPVKRADGGLLNAVYRRVKTVTVKLMGAPATSTQLGVAVGLGVLIGCTPLWGFQLLICLGLAFVFRLNRVAVLLGVQVSAPPFAPFLLFANAQLGAWILNRHFLPLSVSALRMIPPRQLLGELAMGGLGVGAVLALVFGFATAGLVHSGRTPGAVERSVGKVAWTSFLLQLEGLPRSLKSYARWKLRLDPMYPCVLAALPEHGEWVDLGCGIGLALALAGASRPGLHGTGVEWDVPKAQAARTLCRGLERVSVRTGDARSAVLGTPHVITLLDVLHYGSRDEQETWLRACVAALLPGGLLLIRELNPKGRSALAPWLERMAVLWRWNRASGVHIWRAREIAVWLETLGLSVTIQASGNGVFSANALVFARKD